MPSSVLAEPAPPRQKPVRRRRRGGIFARFILGFVLGVVRRPKLTLAISLLMVLACGLLAYFRLPISTNEDKLFSPKVPFFAAWLDFVDKFPENEAIYVIVRANATNKPTTGQWIAAADAVTAKLRQLPANRIKSVDSRVPVDALGSQGLLFQDAAKIPGNLDDAAQFVPFVKLWGERPGLVRGLLGDTPTARFLAGFALARPRPDAARLAGLIAASATNALQQPAAPLTVGNTLPDLAQLGGGDASDFGYYFVNNRDPAMAGQKQLLVRVYPVKTDTSLTAMSETVAQIRQAVHAALQPFPDFTAGVTGRPTLAADELSTTDRDSHLAETAAAITVFVALVIFMRSIWLALAAEIALGVGIGWTFGWAAIATAAYNRAAVGELNLLSLVFLIALIGIGMDYLIQILIRYRREASLYPRPGAVWTRVFKYVAPPINTACLGAACAFLVSCFTDFRGAAELGLIAGGGLLLCLLTGYTVLPALLTLIRPRVPLRAPTRRFVAPPPPMGWRRLITTGLWLAVILGALPLAMRTGFNPNLLDLQDPAQESVQLIHSLDTWSAVVLSKDLSQLRAARAAVADSPFVASTDSILNAIDNADWLRAHAFSELGTVNWSAPKPIAAGDVAGLVRRSRQLAAKFAAAPGTPEIVALAATATEPAGVAYGEAAASLNAWADALSAAPADAVAARMTAWQSAFVEELKRQLQQFFPAADAPDLSKLPHELLSHYQSADGTFALYVYPKQDLWERTNLRQFTLDVQSRVQNAVGLTPTGIAPDVLFTTAAVRASFVHATVYALGLIVLLVFLDLRKPGLTVLAISVLALGLPALVELMGLIGLEWNFANFFGLPILIGAGHEYGVFLVHRYREACEHPERVWKRWDASDRALLLCAIVTSSAFAYFWWTGHHRGLKSLGLVMALGTCCIYAAGALALRPVLKWRLERHCGR